MPGQKAYDDAATAVAAGTATPAQQNLNNTMAGIARTGFSNVQNAQDSQRAADKKKKK